MVLHIITSLDVGGAETMLKKLVVKRREIGENDIVICLRGSGSIAEELISNDIEVYFLNINSLFNLIQGIYKLHLFLRKSRPALVQTWLYHSDLIGGVISWLNKIPVIWNIRQTKFTSNSSFFTILVMRICVLFSYFLPKKIVCAANSSLFSHQKFGYDKKKLIVIPNGFTLPSNYTELNIIDLKNKLGITNLDFVIGSIGRYHEDKDYLNLIDAAQIVLAKYPNSKFILIGKNLDKSNKQLIEYLTERNIDKNFLLLGQIYNVNLYFNLFDIFCVHSKSEGFPNVLGEAMLMKIPCVVTDVGDCRFILNDNGVVVPPENPFHLADGIIHYLNLTLQERKIIGLNSYLRIQKEFMLNNIVQKYTDLYNKFK